jgi:Collagen trimerization domain
VKIGCDLLNQSSVVCLRLNEGFLKSACETHVAVIITEDVMLLYLQAVTFRTEIDMLAGANRLSIGVLAFVMLPKESLYVRIVEGYREIVVSFNHKSSTLCMAQLHKSRTKSLNLLLITVSLYMVVSLFVKRSLLY